MKTVICNYYKARDSYVHRHMSPFTGRWILLWVILQLLFVICPSMTYTIPEMRCICWKLPTILLALHRLLLIIIPAHNKHLTELA